MHNYIVGGNVGENPGKYSKFRLGIGGGLVPFQFLPATISRREAEIGCIEGVALSMHRQPETGLSRVHRIGPERFLGPSGHY